ncbi:MAG: 16S rRNA (uracil(1498)-N(3))-methyltransferase [Actinomycetia bacterium]|nr:16S rRNA (uracil(1498)-N(3))-methyltransferase [Actinomycetes bacterium]
MSDGFFVAELADDVRAGDVVTLVGREARHAAVVRRIRVGEVVTVTNGHGVGVSGAVADAAPERVGIVVESLLSEPKANPSITVVQALPKNDRAELAVDLMTEVGVDRIVPWQATRCVVRWTAERCEVGRDKWETVARESSKQARRLRFPVIAPVATTPDVIEAIRTTELALVMHEREVMPLHAGVMRGVQDCLIVIGPEGGLTDEEVVLFRRAGAATCSLGRTVLRTSTAGAVAITQVRTLWSAAIRRDER